MRQPAAALKAATAPAAASGSARLGRPSDLKLKMWNIYGFANSSVPVVVNQPDGLAAESSSTDSADSALASTGISYLQQTKEMIRHIVGLLDALSKDGLTTEQFTIYPTRYIRQYRHETRLPRYPASWTKQSLVDYLKELTVPHYVGGQRYSDQIGLVSRIVFDLLRTTNSATSDALSAEAFNLGISYFTGIDDISSAQQLYRNMMNAFIEPTNQTFNYFLWTLAKPIQRDPYPNVKGHPLMMVLATLARMRQRNLKASKETWNLALQAMPMGFGKSFLVEEMARRHIPLSDRSISVCMATIIEKQGTEPALEYALSLGESLPSGTLNLLLSTILKHKQPNNRNVERAFKLAEHAKNKLGVPLSTRTLNTFLANFGSRTHLDWQIAILTYYETVHKIYPDTQSLEYLLEAATKLYECEEKYVLVGTILGAFQAKALTPRAGYLVRRAYRRASERGFKVMNPGRQVWTDLKTKLKWTSDIPSADVPALVAGLRGPEIKCPSVGLAKTSSSTYRQELQSALESPYRSLQAALQKAGIRP